MKTKSVLITLVLALSHTVFATDYFCNGQYKKSGSTNYYPNGQYMNSGSTYYYPNGQYANSGATRYYPNGQYMNSGSTWYYPNGQYANSGSTKYYPNGQYVNSGSTCYYENGQSMGSCPKSIPLQLQSKEYTIKVRLTLQSVDSSVFADLTEMETAAEKFTTSFYMSPVRGEISDVQAICSDTNGSERVTKILDLFNSSSTVDKAAVKREICN